MYELKVKFRKCLCAETRFQANVISHKPIKIIGYYLFDTVFIFPPTDFPGTI
jgi:hypothetical protein